MKRTRQFIAAFPGIRRTICYGVDFFDVEVFHSHPSVPINKLGTACMLSIASL